MKNNNQARDYLDTLYQKEKLSNQPYTIMKSLQEERSEILREQEPVKIPVEHPGVLEVPEGKNVEDLPLTHFQGLIKKKGWEEISKALTNLHTWNKEKNPTLSSWANKTQETLSKLIEKEKPKD